jgi:hypothetical protein
MGGGFNQALASAELWPIKAKKKVVNWNPLGDPTVEKFYHKAMEDGRALETSITDANHWLIQRRNQLINKDIPHAINYIASATHAEPDNPIKAILLAKDVITFMKFLVKMQQEVVQLIQAMVQNIGIIESMLQNIVQNIQANLNAIASLLHDICNWALPDLPSIPNLFADTIWHWNGFNFFPLSSFVPHIKFDANFAFGQCQLHVPNVNILRNFPSNLSNYNGLTFGTPVFVPPLGGIIPNTGTNLSDPAFIQKMQSTPTPPYLTGDHTYSLPFNPLNTSANTGGTTGPGPGGLSNVDGSAAANPNGTVPSMLGSLPNPNMVISAYQMPPSEYQGNIVSIVPSVQTPAVPATPATPTTPAAPAVPPSLQSGALGRDVVEPTDPDYSSPDLVTRQANLRADLVRYVTLGNVVDSGYDPILTSAWLFYVGGARAGRMGQWIASFQAAYQQYVQPSLDYLASGPVPWNRVLSGTGLSAGPQAIPLIAAIAAMGPIAQGNALWRLSYIEAAILGYPRNTRWDAYADLNYTGSFTGTDLDYSSVAIDYTSTTTVTLGEGEAAYPVQCTFPSAIGKVLQQVIAIADSRIRLDASYQSVYPQWRYTYNQFAIAAPVDRFTQFWRTFNGSLQSLLLTDPYVVQFVCAYEASLDSAIDPLGDLAIYSTVRTDANSRSRSWVPGSPLLAVPVAPVVVYSSDATEADPDNNGWPGGVLNPVAYLARPDIQGQPIPVQAAMLGCNEAASNLMALKGSMMSLAATAIDSVQQQIQGLSNFGFQVESASAVTEVPPGTGGALVQFDSIDFDLTGYVTSETSFTITSAGAYVITGQLMWGSGGVGVRTVNVYDTSGSPPATTVVATASTQPSQAGPVTLPFSAQLNLGLGDVLTVVATHSLPVAQDIEAGSILSCVLYSSSEPVPTPPSPSTAGTQVFTADADLGALTAVYVAPDGGVMPVDPTSVSQGSPPFSSDAYPFVDGITLNSATAGSPVTVATGYGSPFQVPGAGFVQGGLLYAGPGSASPPAGVGTVTQDYQGTVLPNCSWVICVGRALDSEDFVYEPHLPTRVVMSF